MSKRAVVLGGTSGLGYELARCMIREGVTPIVVGRTAEELIGDPNLPNAVFVPYDLKDEHSANFMQVTHSHADYFFWVAGTFLRKPFYRITQREHRELWQTHVHGPMFLLRQYAQQCLADNQPIRLVTIASSSAYRLRNEESEYCAVKAAKAALTRQLAKEWHEQLPGSTTLLVLPGGMKTEKFWSDTGTDTTQFMDPAVVAKSIWDAANIDDPLLPVYGELNILRGTNGLPEYRWGAQTPEVFTVRPAR